MGKNLPEVVRRTGSASGADHLWLRLQAFLSTRAPNTQVTYVGIIKEWCKFLGAEMGTADAAKKIVGAQDIHAIAFRAWLEKQPGNAPRMKTSASLAKSVEIYRGKKKEKKSGLEATQSNATIWKKFAALRRIYRALIANDFPIKHNPFDTDRVPPPPKDSGKKRPTEMLDFELVTEVINSPDTSTPKGVRDRGILAALFGGGLRRSEAAGIRVGDVRKTSSGTAFLYLRSTKAKKDAEQALPSWASQALIAVVKQRKDEGAAAGDFLFVSYRGPAGKIPTNEPISHSGIYRLFKMYCMAAGAGKFVTPHSARATSITKLLDDGLSHREVQEFSRHASVQMVELYDKRRIGVDENPARSLKFK